MQGRRILVFDVNWLGDVLFSTAAIRNIRYNFPQSFIACVIPPRCYPVLKGNPNLDEIIIFDEKDRQRSLAAKIGFIRFLRRRQFDTVYLLHRSFSRALLCYLAGINERVGYYTKKRSMLLTKKIIPPDVHSVHRVDYYLTLIEKAGLKVEDRFSELFIDEQEEKAADGFLKAHGIGDGDFVVGLNPGGNWQPKRWPIEYWGRLSDLLAEGFKAKIVITGSAKDMELAENIKRYCLHPLILACSTLTLRQFAALSRRFDVFVTADSGPLHIANSMGTKNIIALFGPTDPSLTAPVPPCATTIIRKDVGCRIPCYEVHCQDNRCMKAISPHEVYEKIRLLKDKHDR